MNSRAGLSLSCVKGLVCLWMMIEYRVLVMMDQPIWPLLGIIVIKVKNGCLIIRKLRNTTNYLALHRSLPIITKRWWAPLEIEILTCFEIEILNFGILNVVNYLIIENLFCRPLIEFEQHCMLKNQNSVRQMR